jgi:FMN phosphatase YigB (HAD superfamily)
MFAGKVIVFDLDGTICNVDHRRHWVASKPKNWAAWDAGLPNDTPNEDIIWMLNSFLDSGDIRIILCSGRDSGLREATEAWLKKHHVYYDSLYMRASGDNRKDSIVKVELLHDIQRDWAWPWLWVDDRDQVVKAIREQGVRVLQVAPGDF